MGIICDILEVSYPPTVNHYWRMTNQGMKISAKGRAYRDTVAAEVGYGRQPLTGRIAVTIEVFPPDRRRRDLDNILKSLLDSLEYAHIYVDDAQIDEIHVHRREIVANGLIRVKIVELC